ncbi:MAG: glycosyltransferase family 9 protein [Ignavibacteria bacterium]
MLENIIHYIIRILLRLPENKSRDLGCPKKILIVRQHNQLGDLLATVSLFRAIKGKYPESEITLIVSPANYLAVTKNKFIDRIFIYDKKQLFYFSYLIKLWRLLRESYDIVIVPVNVSISFTSDLIARFSNSGIRIGVSELNGEINKSAYLFDRRVVMDWRKHPDCNVSMFCHEILSEFGITTNDFSAEINFDKHDTETAEAFLKETGYQKPMILIGLHVGAGKPPNRWPLKKFAELIERLDRTYNAKFYLTGSSADREELSCLKELMTITACEFIDRTIPEVAAVISKSDLFITNDTGIMHVAGATKTSQVSIFGPTNPYNWAPIGTNKQFLRKSELIDDITVDDVFETSVRFLSRERSLN